MAFWGISRLTKRPAFAVVARYGLAVASVATALGTTLILRHYRFPAHFISHFTLIAIAITFFGAPGQWVHSFFSSRICCQSSIVAVPGGNQHPV
jgi:ABC-type Mn2+/Zn2+ transport system permease subunit